MKKYSSHFQKWSWGFLSSCLCLVFLSPSFGQNLHKNDYIVVGDSVLSHGVVRDLPTENNTAIHFARSKKSETVKYTVEDVTEFQISNRLFFRKDISQGNQKKTVFLEKLSNSVPDAVIWRLNEETAIYFLETPEGIEVLGEFFRGQLTDSFDNPLLSPLIDLTGLNDISLIYLSRTANTIEKPRTFSKIFVATPFVGYSSQTVGLIVPDSNQEIRIAGSSPAVGINGEAFLNFKRSLSFNVGFLWTRFDSQNFVQYEFGQKRYESDVFLDLSLLQIPVTARYYIDLEPNKWRLFGEAGYSYGFPSYEKLGVYQAEKEGNSIVTSNKEFEMSDRFSGYTWGIGIERYISKHRGLVLGVRQFKLDEDGPEFIQGLTFLLGYKF